MPKSRKAPTPRTRRASSAATRSTKPDASGWFDPAKQYWFDEEAADVACEFFPRFLRHTKGEHGGRPFQLERWERDDIVRPLFGWKVLMPNGTWRRKYFVVWVEVPRKNGKSTLAAGIALKLTFADFEPGAEVYSTAADREQANVVFSEASTMRNADPELRRRSLAYKRAIVVPALSASYKVLSADAGTKHGLNAHGIINDEVHAHKSRDLYDVLHTSTGARRQPVEFNITTAGYDKNSIAYELHDYALKVKAGIVLDDSFLPVIYAAAANDDWKDPKTWAKANPNLGVSISIDALRKECERAQAVPGYENTFKRLHLNMWTEQASRWLPMDKWDAAPAMVDTSALDGAECWGGLDLSSTSDITALVLDFPDGEGGHDWLAVFWVPEENIRRRAERDRVPYDVWVRQGLIRVTPGNIVDYDRVRADINALSEQYQIREIAIDRWNATQLTTQLTGDGFTVVPFGQGYASMSAPSKELEKLVLGGQLRHGGNAVLRWMASNVATTSDPAGNLKPAKDKSGEKIDGIVAGIMALGRAIVSDSSSGIDAFLKDPVIV